MVFLSKTFVVSNPPNTERRGGRICPTQLSKDGQKKAKSFNNDQYTLCNLCYVVLLEDSPFKTGEGNSNQPPLPPLPPLQAVGAASASNAASASTSRTTSSDDTLRQIPINGRAANRSGDMDVDAEQILEYQK